MQTYLSPNAEMAQDYEKYQLEQSRHLLLINTDQ